MSARPSPSTLTIAFRRPEWNTVVSSWALTDLDTIVEELGHLHEQLDSHLGLSLNPEPPNLHRQARSEHGRPSTYRVGE